MRDDCGERNYARVYSRIIGGLLRKRREELGLLLKECAAQLNQHPSSLSRLERGVAAINVDLLFPYCWLLGLDPSELMSLGRLQAAS